MKLSELKRLLQEVLKENPTIAPARPKTDPGIKTTPKRHPLFPPKDSPKPAPKGQFLEEQEEDLLGKIAQRYEKLKQ